MKKLASLGLAALLVLNPTVTALASNSTPSFSEPDYVDPVKVFVSKSSSNLQIELKGNYSIQEKATIVLQPGLYHITKQSGKVSIQKDGKTLFTNSELTLFPLNYSLNSSITFSGKKYLGNLLIQPNRVINELPMDHYLYGVVPYEIGNGAPKEAQKAQAVSARTYAAKQGDTILESDEMDQVYRGYDASKSNSIQAVNETQGAKLTYNGSFVETFYSASNGGYTLSPKNSWAKGTNLPYLLFQKDEFDNTHQWTFTVAKEQLTEEDLEKKWTDIKEKEATSSTVVNLKSAIKSKTGTTKEIKLKTIDSIEFTLATDNPGPNVHFVGKVAMTYLEKQGEQFIEKHYTLEDSTYNFYSKRYLGNIDSYSAIRSPNVKSVSLTDDKVYVISGGGYGHAIGMSQNGAMERARQGHTFQQILAFYYPNTELTSVTTGPVFTQKSNPISNLPEEEIVVPETPVEQPKPEQPNKPEKPGNENQNPLYYTVEKGDTLWGISIQFGVPVDTLKELNNLTSNTIYVGQQLLVGEGTTENAKPDQPKPEEPKDEAKPEPTKPVEPSKPTKPEKPKDEPKQVTYKVKKGDTLWGISREYKIPVSSLMKENNLSSSVIHVGQSIKIPGKVEEKPATKPEQNTKPSTYVVKKGDSLWKISRENNVSIDTITTLNKLTSTVIHPGMKLKLSDSGHNVTPPKDTNKVSSYKVKKGDTLWGISQKVNKSVSYLMNKNNLKNSIIYVNQTLKY